MGTRATIGIETAQGSNEYEVQYVHSDGGYEWTGKALDTYIGKPDEVRDMLIRYLNLSIVVPAGQMREYHYSPAGNSMHGVKRFDEMPDCVDQFDAEFIYLFNHDASECMASDTMGWPRYDEDDEPPTDLQFARCGADWERDWRQPYQNNAQLDIYRNNKRPDAGKLPA